MMQTSQLKHNNQTESTLMLGTTLLPLLQALNSLKVLVIFRTVAIKIDYSRSGWTDCDLLIVNLSTDTLISCILSLQAPKIIWGCPGAIILLCHPKWHLKYLATQRDVIWLC